MTNIRNTLLTLGLALVTGSACDLVTDPDPLEQFSYTELERGTAVEEFVTATPFVEEFVLLGELNTPQPCFQLEPRVQKEGRRITFRLEGKRSGTSECPQVLGAYRYQAVISYLERGTYDVRVIHSFDSSERETRTFDLEVSVR